MRPRRRFVRAGRRALTGADGAASAARRAEVVRRLAEFGPYFALSVGARTDDAGFRPLRELYEVPGLLAEHVRQIGTLLRTDELRVAASVLHLGLAARLWSVALGGAVSCGAVPLLDPGRTQWRREAPGPVELWDPELGFAAGDPSGIDGGLAEALHDAVVDRHLVPLARAVRAVTPVAEQLLWGNAASALAGTAQVLEQGLRPEAPAQADAALRLARALQASGVLRGTGTWADPPPSFRRNSCCLYYRTPEGGTCGDCVFGDDPPRTRRTEPPTAGRAALEEPSA
ncbi:(2Fe-2S)-binding protein [Yinghuangia soli]|uniref:(2Fe-2S)-binding protein n=1 Tax=Yinghuangia soli TaxID=2908204 RepID=A0AA41U121_9ACTN|nr:(2Fe-2S)-binding protein [Yinghuangia soli]MCF2527042.1 (2Fe-2S)-binding protein [Yinghuangia soli]